MPSTDQPEYISKLLGFLEFNGNTTEDIRRRLDFRRMQREKCLESSAQYNTLTHEIQSDERTIGALEMDRNYILDAFHDVLKAYEALKAENAEKEGKK